MFNQTSAVRSTPTGEAEYDTSASAEAKQSGTCQRVEFEKTENGGFTARASYKAPQNPKGDVGYMEPKTYAFSSLPEAQAFLATAFGGSASPAPAIDSESAEAMPA